MKAGYFQGHIFSIIPVMPAKLLKYNHLLDLIISTCLQLPISGRFYDAVERAVQL